MSTPEQRYDDAMRAVGPRFFEHDSDGKRLDRVHWTVAWATRAEVELVEKRLAVLESLLIEAGVIKAETVLRVGTSTTEVSGE